MQVTANTNVIEVSGSPVDQARQIGEATKDDIQHNLTLVRADRQKIIDGGLSASKYDESVKANLRFVELNFPEVADEIRAVSEGAVADFYEVVDLNLLAHMVLARTAVECSQLVIGPGRSRDGSWMLGKNRDMSQPSLTQTVVWRRYEDGTEIAESIHAGAVTAPGSGVNNRGMALSTSGVWPKSQSYDTALSGQGWNLINPHLSLRDCATLDELEDHLRRMPRLTGINIAATDGAGGAIFELTADCLVRLPAVGGAAVETNHWTATDLSRLSPTRQEYLSTYARHECLSRLVNSRPLWDESDVWAALSDHSGGQTPVCRHAHRETGHDSVTASTTVARVTPTEQYFHVAIGNPCENGPQNR